MMHLKWLNFEKSDQINILLGDYVGYDPLLTLHIFKILLPVSCLPQVAQMAGTKI